MWLFFATLFAKHDMCMKSVHNKSFAFAYTRGISVLLHAINLRQIELDDIPSIRYVHEAALRACAAQHLAPQHVDALARTFHTPKYVSRILNGNVTAAWVDDEIVGTAGWLPASGGEPIARIHMIHVWPMFAGTGVGRKLVAHAESQAYQAGYRRVRARAEISQVPFFRRLGYVVTSQGAIRTPSGAALPVAYLRKECIFPPFSLSEERARKPLSEYHH